MVLIVNEIFSSIQGEGIHSGIPTTFIRLAGCDLRCSWCDTQYALSMDSGESMDVHEVMDSVRSLKIDLVCITGGEPLLQDDVMQLILYLSEEGYRVDVETNGAQDISIIETRTDDLMISMDVKLPSSGEGKSFLVGNLSELLDNDQLKFIIKDENDLVHAISFIKDHRPSCNLIMTPCDNREGFRIVEELINKIKDHDDETERSIFSRVRVMIQTHKVIWSPDRTGV